MILSKKIGISLIILGLLILSLTYYAKIKEDFYIETLQAQLNGTCVLDSGYCLHEDRNWMGYIVSGVAGTSLIVLGAYLFFFEKSYLLFQKQQEKFNEDIKEVKEKDSFNAFLAGFNEEEKKVIQAVKDQEGIQQSTLRFKVGMSKTSLSLLLQSLEERSIISREEFGKTKKLYLQKKF